MFKSFVNFLSFVVALIFLSQFPHNVLELPMEVFVVARILLQTLDYRAITSDKCNLIRYYVMLFLLAFSKGVLIDLLFGNHVSISTTHIAIFVIIHLSLALIFRFKLSDVVKVRAEPVKRNTLFLLTFIGDAIKLAHLIHIYVKQYGSIDAHLSVFVAFYYVYPSLLELLDGYLANQITDYLYVRFNFKCITGLVAAGANYIFLSQGEYFSNGLKVLSSKSLLHSKFSQDKTLQLEGLNVFLIITASVLYLNHNDNQHKHATETQPKLQIPQDQKSDNNKVKTRLEQPNSIQKGSKKKGSKKSNSRNTSPNSTIKKNSKANVERRENNESKKKK